MKKYISMMWVAMGAMALTTFTSCEEDPWGPEHHPHYWYDDYDNYGWNDHGSDDYDYSGSTYVAEANCLRGHWEGTMYYTYTNDETGQRESVQFDADMEFDQYDSSENPLRGRGREIDTAGDETQTLTFSWYVDEKNGDIYIQYDGSKKTYVLDAQSSRHGFYLDTDTFNGYMIGTDSDDVIEIDFTRYTYAKPNVLAKTRAAKAGSDVPRKLVYRR